MLLDQEGGRGRLGQQRRRIASPSDEQTTADQEPPASGLSEAAAAAAAEAALPRHLLAADDVQPVHSAISPGSGIADLPSFALASPYLNL